jgi:hypothetical protein
MGFLARPTPASSIAEILVFLPAAIDGETLGTSFEEA